MNVVYLTLVIILLSLGIAYLIVSVSNNTFKFLNSVFDTKKASKWIIFMVVALMVTGISAAIGEWFYTTFIALTVPSIFVYIMLWSGFITIIVLVVVAMLYVFGSPLIYRLMGKSEVFEDDDENTDQQISSFNVLDKCNTNTVKVIISTSKAYFLCFEGFFNSDRYQMKKAMTEVNEFNANAKKMKDNVYKNILKLQQESIETGHFYVQVVDYLREMAHALHYIVEPVFIHFEEHHKPFTTDQVEQFNSFTIGLNEFFNHNLYVLKEGKFEELDEVIGKRNLLVEQLEEIEKAQIKRIKNKEVSTRNSMLYFKIISETKSLLYHLINVVKAQRDFIQNSGIII